MATPPGLNAPLVTVTAFDKSGVIIIITALTLALSLVSLLIRAYVRYEFSPQRFALDDLFVGIAFLFSIIQNAIVFWEAGNGLGQKTSLISPSSLVKVQKGEYADDFMYILSVWATKLSVIFLFLRLSPKRGHKLAAWVDTGVTALTAVVAIFVIAFRCDISHPWIHINSKNAQCTGLLARWIVVAVFDIGTEILLFATSVYLLYGLQMPLSKRVTIMSSFALRLPLIVPIIVRLHYLDAAFNSSNYTLLVTWAVVCKETQICYAIIGATIPCLKPFMSAMATNYGAPAEGARSKMGTYGKNTYKKSGNQRDGRNGFNLASLKLGGGTGSGSHNVSEKHDTGADGLYDGVYDGRRPLNRSQSGVARGHNANVTSTSTRKVGSIESGDSQQHIIRKDVEYAVEYDDDSHQLPIQSNRDVTPNERNVGHDYIGRAQ